MENGKGSFFWVEEESNDPTFVPIKQQQRRRVVKTNKPEFVGWCSKPLYEFLQSIGNDTTKEQSQHEVTSIINNYVNMHNLTNPLRKKKVDCDDRLRYLFIKKSIARNKIFELLNPHLAKNHDSSSEDDDNLYSSEEEYDDDNRIATKKQKIFNLLEKNAAPPRKKKTSETQLSSIYAAVIPENIKLLYLKRSLVEELVKQHSFENFQGKMVGSYIRIKSDPNDFFQKNSHQLHPVTGVKNVLVNGVIHEVLLQVPNMIKDLPICMLSDEDFSKEECEDLCQRVKDGLLKRPTVVEVEQKTQVLHEDIIKHWIPRELKHLQNLIDRANEKGWRKELFDYLERKKLLQTPSEVSKLLADVPNVTADKLDPELTPQEQAEDINELHRSPTTHKDVSHPTLDASEHEVPVLVEVKEGNAGPMENGRPGEHLTGLQWVEVEQVPKTKNSGQKAVLNGSAGVIELSDDEEETQKQEDQEETHKQDNQEETLKQDDEYDFSCKKWFYRDPQGKIQGPVSRTELKVWSDAGYFYPDFKVWKDGQTPDDAILLTDMLSGNCSKC
uniref:uncharacterized protein At5g08430 n=1 Tax=Erigeron canadensis TaxID=72917 RepID=UPI001CB9A84B|nr:uncharacterized protein At5g08430 [Erigeron canadensis]XP_043612337.1 uncharacterized protein At5g08430 [Erigeron canadensis]